MSTWEALEVLVSDEMLTELENLAADSDLGGPEDAAAWLICYHLGLNYPGDLDEGEE